MRSDVRLKNIAEDLRAGDAVQTVTPREMVSWFGGKRRDSWVVWLIREALTAAGLTTEPDFESAYIDTPLEFRLLLPAPMADVAALEAGADEAVIPKVESATDVPAYADPTYRLSRLEAANRRPLSVSPNACIKEAVTLMMANDFSQLPVMSGEREVKGVISWHSIGTRLGLGKGGGEVREVMDPYYEIPSHASLFQAIPIIVLHQYVLVRGRNKSIVGIVTASDLSLQFQQLSEPFLLLAEIENHIRRILSSRLSVAELAAAKDPGDEGRTVERAADLTYGEYLRLIENPGEWCKLSLAIDRVAFANQLDRVRAIRNDVMHFDPDGIPAEDLDHLRKMVGFLQRLQEIGIS